MMSRKAIYITTENDRVYVLCDDGTIWTLDVLEIKPPSAWEQLPDIPQPGEKQK